MKPTLRAPTSRGTGAARITILVDDRAAEGLRCEHGFAAWIEVAGRRLLFDTGQGAALAGNADELGVDLRTADTLVLSHLNEASEARLARTLAELQELGPELIVPCHCTGDAAVARLRQGFGARVVPGSAGAVFRFSGAFEVREGELVGSGHGPGPRRPRGHG